jgi:nucleoside-diphosphate-sugar epimerase
MVGESMIFAYGFGDHGVTAKVESDALQAREANPGLQAVVDALRSLESQLLEANRQGLIEAIPLRYGLFYGRGNPATEFMLQLVRKRLFPVLSNVQGLASWIHVEDAVRATVAALEQGKGGEIYNIVDDCPVSMNDWARYAAQLVGAKPPVSIPLWLMKVAMPYVADFSSTRLAVSNAKAKSELGWQPQFPSYREGLSGRQ